MVKVRIIGAGMGT